MNNKEMEQRNYSVDMIKKHVAEEFSTFIEKEVERMKKCIEETSPTHFILYEYKGLEHYFYDMAKQILSDDCENIYNENGNFSKKDITILYNYSRVLISELYYFVNDYIDGYDISSYGAFIDLINDFIKSKESDNEEEEV